jgi:hypothetical protein
MEIEIPHGHFKSGSAFVPHWEVRLRASIADEPDAAKRFTKWLDRLAAGECEMPGVRLIFLEQPYLGWAETIQRAIETAEKELRALIAFEVAHPGAD